MTNTNDLFDDKTDTNDTDTNQSEGSNPFEELVGEGKKFKDPVALAKSKLEADRFIAQLQSENKNIKIALKKLEEEKNKAATISELLNEIKNSSKQSSENQSPVSVDEILKVVDSRLTLKEQEKARLSNRTHVAATIENKFNGDREAAKKFLGQKQRELGLTADQMRELSEESPTALFSMLGFNQQKGNTSSGGIPGSVNTDALNQGGTERNQKFYAELRKKMGVSKYFADHALQKQLYRDMDRLGDKFFET